VILASAVPDRHGQEAINHYLDAYRSFGAKGPVTPVSLVNFGEAVNFPLILGVVLVLFGAATLVHLLVVSVARRRRDIGLLKALGFLNRQVGAAVCWQATTVALVGIMVGVPLGVATGRLAWRVFATNLGAVPFSSVPVWLIAALAVGVLSLANVLAVLPALAAARSEAPGVLLRAQ
jgi:ABC-type lipoprotein release transport system permease subunit